MPRDLRLDFFRGLSLWFIFLDHVPANVLNWVTVRNYGLSDATEIFVFISGCSAALAYGNVLRKHGFALAAARILKRCWQLYLGHLVLFLFFTAQIAYVAARFSNPMYVEELNITHLIDAPYEALLEALLLQFRPANIGPSCRSTSCCCWAFQRCCRCYIDVRPG